MNKQTSQPDDCLSIVYSVVNQAWFVMWHDQVLRIINDRQEAEEYVRFLRE